jgi:hypothetical protein
MFDFHQAKAHVGIDVCIFLVFLMGDDLITTPIIVKDSYADVPERPGLSRGT